MEYLNVLEPEPVYEDPVDQWICIPDAFTDRDDFFRCDRCEIASSTSFYEITENKASCLNCCSNDSRLEPQVNYRESCFRAAARILYHFGMSKCAGAPDLDIANMDPHGDLNGFVIEMARIFAKDSNFQKEISGFGALRVSANTTRSFFKNGRVQSIHVVKEHWQQDILPWQHRSRECPIHPLHEGSAAEGDLQ